MSTNDEIIDKKFQALKNNNNHGDWNGGQFRQTIVNAFKYCAKNILQEALQTKEKEIAKLNNEIKSRKQQYQELVKQLTKQEKK